MSELGAMPPILAGPAAPEPGLGEPVTARILVADDDPRNLLAVEAMLRGPGIELVLAQSGEEVLRHVLGGDFAVILLDVQMPRIDGYEAASLVRSRPRSSRIPIIFLTAYNKEDLHVFRGYTAGAVDYVFKPIEPLILKSKVDVFVDLYRKTEEIRRQGEAERRLLIENLRVRNEKLEAERALRRAQERQEAILRSLPVVVTSRAATAPFPALFVSENVERLTGFSAMRFTQEPAFGFERMHPEDREHVLEQLAGTVERGQYSCEYRWRCADEQYRHFLDQGVLAPTDEGAPPEIFGTLFDVSDRREMEQQLLHASKLEALGRLTGGIAHDFNNMLAVVMGSLELLQKFIPDHEVARRRAGMAMDAARRCADLTGRLLTFSRRQQLQATRTDLRELVGTMLEILGRTLGDRIEIAFEPGEDLWPVLVDRSQLENALLNLAINARDAMPDGGKLTITLADRRLDGPERVGDFVEIAVQDTGAGIPPDVLDRVFEPFFTTKEEGKGTGLGLSMIYGFAQQSGGHITIESEPGRGTTVRMFLPRTDQTAEAEAELERHQATRIPPNATILVVEDDEEVRHVASSTLTELGFAVREAEDGERALQLLTGGENVDLVFTDISMPGKLTGTALAREVHRRRPELPVLLTSGNPSADGGVEEFEILLKPYRAEELRSRITSMLAR